MMKARVGMVAAALLTATLMLSPPARAQAFTGDVRSACEAILCLATPQRPSECNAALVKYFSISMRKFKDTMKARKNFLALCPKTNVDLDKVVAASTPVRNDESPTPPSPPNSPTLSKP